MKAEIISVGTEILLGEIVNTNSSYLASQLPGLGIDLYFIATVGDNKQRLVQVLDQAFQRSDIVILTGGLGPTQDDLTREAVAEFLHEQITTDSVILDQLNNFFEAHRLNMAPTNVKQAGIIPSAKIIPNDRGTAPGWWIPEMKN